MSATDKLREIRRVIETATFEGDPEWPEVRPIMARIYELTENPIEEGLCFNCGALIKRYPHTLSAGIVSGLSQLYDVGGGPIHIKRELGLEGSQWTNFQKLRYWDLVRPIRIDGKSHQGIWAITDRGIDFIEGRIAIYNKVFSYRGVFDGFEGDLVTINSSHPIYYREAEDYARDAEPI